MGDSTEEPAVGARSSRIPEQAGFAIVKEVVHHHLDAHLPPDQRVPDVDPRDHHSVAVTFRPNLPTDGQRQNYPCQSAANHPRKL